MRVGFLSAHDPHDPGAFSGTTHSTWAALRAAGVDLVDLSVAPARPAGSPLRAQVAGQAPVLRQLARRWRQTRQDLAKWAARPWEYGKTLERARALSLATQAKVDAAGPLDALIGVCMSPVLLHLETDLPIVYASDTTARLINSTYPSFQKRAPGFHRASDEIERTALHKSRFFLPASQRTADSAIEEYGMPPERVRVVAFGAHVVPPAGTPIDPDPPCCARIELVLVGADPRRKRLDLCIAVTKALRARGWQATLNFVGGHHPMIDGEDCVAWAGRLQLRDPEDRKKHQAIMRRSHWMLLPSLAEAYGIAPCEAAHFGRPSVVTDVGGLSTVVQHGKTGMVVPVEADAAAFADAIIAVSSDPMRYAAMSAAALHRARTVLSWPAWAQRTREILEEAIGH